MRIIPKQTRVRIQFYRNLDLPDVIIGMVGIAIAVFLFSSNLPGRFWIMFGVGALFFTLLMKLDNDKVYMMILHLLKHLTSNRSFSKGAAKKSKDIRAITPFTGISDDCIEYDGEYFSQVIEIDSIEFRFLDENKQDTIIERILGASLRQSGDLMVSLIKLDRPVNYDAAIDFEHKKIEHMKTSHSNGLFSDEELDCRIEVIHDRIEQLKALNTKKKVIRAFYYLMLFDKSKLNLKDHSNIILHLLSNSEMNVRLLGDAELAVFCKYNYTYDFDERDITSVMPEDYMNWILPEKLDISSRKYTTDGVTAHTLRVTNYPTLVYNAWGHRIFNIPDTKVVMKMTPMDKSKSITRIDRAIDELRSQAGGTGKTSRLIELDEHIKTLSNLLALLQNDSETLFEVNLYITIFDRNQEERTGAKKRVRTLFNEEGFRCEDGFMRQLEAYIGSGLSAYDPLYKEGRAIHSSSAAAIFPFVHSTIHDSNGIVIGDNGRNPILIDFFKRDHSHVNSNMVIIGKSGSGKSFATKTILTNLAAEDSKVFILDPENEYGGVAKKLNGKVIDVGSSKSGRLNPFHIVPSIAEEDEEADTQHTSFSAHLQFLEEFFRQIVPDVTADAMEMLNTAVVRTYESKGIDDDSNFTKLSPADFPTFDDLYDNLLSSFQATQSEFGKNNLRILLTHISKFAGEGRNAHLWNGEATITTNENFVVFNFQTLVANRNRMVANAQMLLVLKWLDNEIIKNRDYNIRYGSQRKIIIVVDEAHVFIDSKYPVALDFMFQLAKRIRKYNGMQIIITQNIKDFVGSEELARKSTAIINACQYSFIFALAPNDMHDLCKLYEKAGEINESEQREIINNGRGQAFVVTSPGNRTRIHIQASEELQKLF
ncbi:MAG: ATP-binding protein [Oscillospiraceae bacterium]|nr:ATP-binding protein [Oscillospiraceae bacterium]